MGFLEVIQLHNTHDYFHKQSKTTGNKDNMDVMYKMLKVLSHGLCADVLCNAIF